MRRSHDLSLEITDLLHGRGTSRPESNSLAAGLQPLQCAGMMNVECPSSL